MNWGDDHWRQSWYWHGAELGYEELHQAKQPRVMRQQQHLGRGALRESDPGQGKPSLDDYLCAHHPAGLIGEELPVRRGLQAQQRAHLH